MLATRIGFVGSGRMATALARGLVQTNTVHANSIVACDPSNDARRTFESAVPGALVAASCGTELGPCDVVWLAVKPQKMNDALAALRGIVRHETLVVSIAAGITLDRLAAGLPVGQRIVRVMPNTPCLIGHGASAFSLGVTATRDDGQLVATLLRAVGAAFEVPESLLDAVTGLSGSGPAFVYGMIEGLSEGGIAAGLPAELAAELATRTAVGAALMVLQTGETPATLRDRVTSPGGTTLAGLNVLKERGFHNSVIEAVLAATKRSEELGRTTL
ncbi:MAG: pyrroline-5-carboxylate reductase [Pirellulales bacterium]|nr:pyrroline-5-carboxylate reductase [Pirellulales bacterium]